MPASPQNPHDAYFRRVLSRPADAASIISPLLPGPVAAQVEWDSLKLLSTSFVSEDLRSRYGDLLFRARINDREAYLYALIEHQSGSDPLMAFRMSELIDLDDPTRVALGPYLPHLRFLLDDITTVDVEAIRARHATPAATLMLVLQKIAPANDRLGTELMPLITEFVGLLAGPTGVDDLRCLLKYIFYVGETKATDLDPLIDQLGEQAKEAMMTTADQLRAEGAARGHAEGRAEGRAEALTELLTAKFGTLPGPVAATIAAASSEELRAWTVRVLTATQLEDVFS
ncbi:Rpn family recombination-promoting nuclease/putative transposase [Nocardia yamanashiensis]|uniref:Rpn family recombination-promoting nuclease/putative transposase n=1 Tax=Nocardia yamanashiensis TaxID=209247 RepID=UPI001E47B870|nr:Rpn family recombination-promoting nuclease/putative transposase [Nocardia yamanashiensis]UGT44295.1 Rpn family recombination-promoting nuclease/putative transposase [Nocardia yamanashiensis]